MAVSRSAQILVFMEIAVGLEHADDLPGHVAELDVSAQVQAGEAALRACADDDFAQAGLEQAAGDELDLGAHGEGL